MERRSELTTWDLLYIASLTRSGWSSTTTTSCSCGAWDASIAPGSEWFSRRPLVRSLPDAQWWLRSETASAERREHRACAQPLEARAQARRGSSFCAFGGGFHVVHQHVRGRHGGVDQAEKNGRRVLAHARVQRELRG
jgi:hypothetical protein